MGAGNLSGEGQPVPTVSGFADFRRFLLSTQIPVSAESQRRKDEDAWTGSATLWREVSRPTVSPQKRSSLRERRGCHLLLSELHFRVKRSSLALTPSLSLLPELQLISQAIKRMI